MRLIKCYVSSFGKLKDFVVDFDNKLTVLNKENGFGKSTLTVFIKSMFYGVTDSKRNISDNERIKYKPWNSTEKFGGYLVYEKDGKQYKIERFFGNKKSEDTLNLTDIESGEQLQVEEDFGKSLFEIDEQGFLSTTFFSEKDVEIKSNSSITTKYNEVFDISSSDSYDNAVKSITAKIKYYKMTGERGRIFELKRQIFEIEKEIESINLAEENLTKLQQELKDVSFEIDELTAKINEVEKQIDLARQYETAMLRKRQFEEYSAQLKDLEQSKIKAQEIFNGNDFSKEDFNVCSQMINKLNSLSERLEVLKKYVDSIKAQKEKEVPKAKPFNLALLIVSVVLLLAGIGLFFYDAIFGTVFAIIGLVCFGLSFVLKNKVKKVEDDVLEQNTISEYLGYEKLFEESKRALDEYLSKFNLESTNYYESLQILEKARNQVDLLDESISRMKKMIGELNYVPTKILDISIDLKEVQARSASLKKDYGEKLDLKSKILSRISNQEIEVANLTNLESKKFRLNGELQECNNNYNILKKTLEFLEIADKNLKIRYKKPIQDSFTKYLSLMTRGKILADIDVDFDVKAYSNGGSFSVDYFSKGYRNLFEICKRFALIEVLFAKEKPFIVLDDPFVNLDEEKLSLALDLVKNLSENYQVLYFVCHNSREVKNG